MSRNASGVYSLPLPAVVPGTLITAAWANATMNDIAQAITDSLDRNGRGGMNVPLRVDGGNVAQPGYSFNGATNTGMYSTSSGLLEFAILGSKKLEINATGLSLTGNAAVSGNLTVAGTTTFSGPVAFPLGTAALPSLTFTGDLNTGFYSPGADQLAWSTGGTSRYTVDSNGTHALAKPAAASSSTLLIRQADNGFALDILGDSSTEVPKVRLVNSAYTTELARWSAEAAGITFGSVGALPISLMTSSITRMSIGATGGVTLQASSIFEMSGSTLLGVANIGGNANAGAYTIWGGRDPLNGAYVQLYGASHATNANQLFLGNAGTTRLTIDANGFVGIRTTPVTSSSYLQLLGDITFRQANCAVFYNSYFDGANFRAAGTGPGIIVKSGGSATSAYQWYAFGNTAGGAVATVSEVYDLNSLNHLFKSPVLVGPSVSQGLYGITWDTVVYNVVANAAQHVGWINTATGASASVILHMIGGTANSYMNHSLHDNSGAPYIEDLIGAAVGSYRIAFNGVESARWSPPGGTNLLTLTDAGAAGPNLKLVHTGATPNKYIRNISGTLEVISSSYAASLFALTDGGALSIAAGMVANTSTGSTFVASGGVTNTSAGCPVGTIVIAEVITAPVNAFGTITANTNNLSVKGTSGGGANATINFGTWRNLGATTTSTTVCMWQRIA